MDTLKILVAEDNALHASRMEMIIDQMGYDLVGIYANQADLIKAFVNSEPDLIILDIELESQSDGVEIARELQVIRPVPIIFATSFEDKETISRALQTNPYAYLVKPVEKSSLQAAIELAIYKFGKQDVPVAAKTETSEYEDVILRDSFFIKSGSKLLKVKVEDILWIGLAQDRYCDVVTAERRYQVRASLNQLEEKLDPQMFIRIHRSTIVNLNAINGLDEADMTIEVVGTELPLGSVYKNDLIKKMRLL